MAELEIKVQKFLAGTFKIKTTSKQFIHKMKRKNATIQN